MIIFNESFSCDTEKNWKSFRLFLSAWENSKHRQCQYTLAFLSKAVFAFSEGEQAYQVSLHFRFFEKNVTLAACFTGRFPDPFFRLSLYNWNQFFDIHPYCSIVKMHNKKMPVLRYQEYLLDAILITKNNFFEAFYLWKPHTNVWMVIKMLCKHLFWLHKQNRCSVCFFDIKYHWLLPVRVGSILSKNWFFREIFFCYFVNWIRIFHEL